MAEQLAFLEQHADDILAGKIELPGLPEIEPTPGPSPYMGLQYFDVADAPNFFGREALTAELVGYLRDHSLLAVVGASGSGKSSLVRAGLIPPCSRDGPWRTARDHQGQRALAGAHHHSYSEATREPGS